MGDDSGKCSTCGFFGAREGAFGTPHVMGPLLEISHDLRSRGCVTTIAKGNSWVPAVPVCAVGQINAADIIQAGAIEKKCTHEEMAIELLSFQRNCPKWYQYSPGLSPSEHLEEKRMLDFTERQEKFQAAMLERQEKFISNIETSRRAWESEREKEADKRAARSRWVDIILVLIAIAIAVPGVLFISKTEIGESWFIKLFE